ELAAVLVDQQLAESGGAVELLAVGQASCCVDLNPAIFATPLANAVEIFEGEADGVHAAVAGGADRVGAVHLQLFAHAQLPAVRADGLQLRYVRRGRGRGSAEQILENPLAALHDGRTVGVGGDGQDAALAQQAAARRTGRQGNLAELRSVDVGDAVVLGETLVEIRVVRVEHFEDVAVFAEDARQE